MLPEPLAAEVALLQAPALQQDTPGPVEDHDPLGQCGLQSFAYIHG